MKMIGLETDDMELKGKAHIRWGIEDSNLEFA